jgi:hypothetical protein
MEEIISKIGGVNLVWNLCGQIIKDNLETTTYIDGEQNPYGQVILNNLEKTIIVDFDGTIIEENLLIDISDLESLSGVRDGLKKLKKEGYIIKIWSCRTSSLYPIEFRKQQKAIIENFLKKHNIPFDVVLMIDKPFALCYVDSRAVKPKWNDITEQINKLKKN